MYEVRRRFSIRAMWLLFLAVFAFFFGFMWLTRTRGSYFDNGLKIDGGTPLGLLSGTFMSTLFVILIPFIATELVAFDLRRRTHELLMTTPVPTWAYVWGRYIAGLVVVGGLLFAMLTGFLLMGLFLSNGILPDSGYPFGYPPLNIGALLLLWSLIVLPITLLIQSISFVLGTFFPSFTNAIKALVVIVYYVVLIFNPYLFNASTAVWDPSGYAITLNVTSNTSVHEYTTRIRKEHAQTVRQQLKILRDIEQEVPDTSQWWLPRIVYILLSFVAVALTAHYFQRFRRQLNT